MNAHSLYDLTCRLLLGAGNGDCIDWADLGKILPRLRGALSCTACGNILNEPQSPTHDICQHHVCRTCIGAIKHHLKPVCSWCKDSELYSENKQLEIILKCFRKLCQYLKVSPIYVKLLDYVKEGGSFELLNIINEVNGDKLYTVDSCNMKNFVNNSTLTSASHNSIFSNNLQSEEYDEDLEVKIESENTSCYNRTSIDDEVFSEPSTNGEIQTICESDIAPVFRNSDDEEMLDDNAPILSPIPEHIGLENDLSENENPPVLVPNSNYKSTKNVFNIDNVEVHKASTEPSISSNTETEINSDSSSMSSISSPVEILSSNIESTELPLQEYNLPSESVLEFQTTDLMGAADVNVLATLDDGSYSELADINLSTYTLSSLGEDTPLSPCKENSTASVSQNTISFQTFSPSKQISSINTISTTSDHQLLSNKTDKTNNTNVLTDPLAIDKIEVKSEPVHSSPINTLFTNSYCSSVPISNTFTVGKISDSISRCSTNNPAPNSSTYRNFISQSNIPSTSKATVCKVEPMTSCVKPQLNSLSETPRMISTSKTNFTANINDINNFNSNIGGQLVSNSLPCPSTLRSNILPSNMMRQPFMSPPLIHQRLPNSSTIIQPPLQNHPLSQASLQSIPSPGSTNLIVSSSLSPVGVTRMVLSPQQHRQFIQHQTVVSSHNLIQTSSIQPQKISAPAICSSVSNISNSSFIGQSSQQLPSSFLNVIRDGHVPSTNNISKDIRSKETLVKGTPPVFNNSSVYSLTLSEEENAKLTIKRSPPHNGLPYAFSQTTKSPPPSVHPPTHILPDHGINTHINNTHHLQFNSHQQINTSHHHQINVHQQQLDQYIGTNLNVKKPVPPPPKTKAKPKPKRKGCRCGNATPSPGKLTCCGQRCPCYVEAKACIDCRCKGCRNPHRPGGKKVRPIIPHQDNIQIHQLQPSPDKPQQTTMPQAFPAQQSLVSPKTNLAAQTVSTSGNVPQTFHTYQGIQTSKSCMANISSFHPSTAMPPNFVKNCSTSLNTKDKLQGDLSLSNIITMKPVKVRFEAGNVIQRQASHDSKIENDV